MPTNLEPIRSAVRRFLAEGTDTNAFIAGTLNHLLEDCGRNETVSAIEDWIVDRAAGVITEESFKQNLRSLLPEPCVVFVKEPMHVAVSSNTASAITVGENASFAAVAGRTPAWVS